MQSLPWVNRHNRVERLAASVLYQGSRERGEVILGARCATAASDQASRPTIPGARHAACGLERMQADGWQTMTVGARLFSSLAPSRRCRRRMDERMQVEASRRVRLLTAYCALSSASPRDHRSRVSEQAQVKVESAKVAAWLEERQDCSSEQQFGGRWCKMAIRRTDWRRIESGSRCCRMINAVAPRSVCAAGARPSSPRAIPAVSALVGPGGQGLADTVAPDAGRTSRCGEPRQ